MKIHKNFILRLLYQPKKVLLTQTVVAGAVVSFIAFSAFYFMYNGSHKSKTQLNSAQEYNLDPDQNQSLAALQAHIASLNSRVKHLSMDNKRLSSTGQKLSQQLRSTSSNIKEQIAHTKEMQLELYALDQHLIRKYDYFIDQQKTFNEAKISCDKEKEKDKSNTKKCATFTEARQVIEDSVSQIKFLKAKREVLISEIERGAV